MMQNEEILNNIYYIYFHINPLKNEIFYVGKGKGNRAYYKKDRSDFWNKISNKYGYIVDIVEENLDEVEAFEREIFYIKKIGRRDLGLGPLVNLTNGGEGCHMVSELTREKLSKAQSGKKLSNEVKVKIGLKSKGRIPTKETRDKMSKSQSGKKLSNTTIEKLRKPKSEATKQKMRKPKNYIKSKSTIDKWRETYIINRIEIENELKCKIISKLQIFKGNITQAMNDLNITRGLIYKYMRKDENFKNEVKKIISIYERGIPENK